MRAEFNGSVRVVFKIMKMKVQLKEKKDIKLYILYLMYHIKCPIDFTMANDISVQDGFVSTLDFAECFAELIDAQTIAEYKEPNGESMFYVTERGEHVVTTLQDSLLSSLRERGLRSAMRFLSFKQRGTRIETEITERSDGFFTLRCTLREKEGVLLEVTLAVPTKQQAERMAYRFTDKPEEAYRAIYSSMKGTGFLY